jgi:hypothetical protein
MPRAVTATFGRNPDWLPLELGPTSAQLADLVPLWKTPTSVPT